MHYQKDQLRGDLLNNHAYIKVFEEVHASLAPCIRASDRFNAICTELDFARAMVHAAAHNGQVAGCANSAKGLDGRRRPGEVEQMRNMASIARRISS